MTARIRILVVDDYEPWRRFCVTLLAREGWHILGECSDGEEAIQKANELKPDLVLLDISLPRINGIAAARRIRQVSPNSKILFVNETRSPEIAKKALSTGAQGYVVKSDGASELLRATKGVLEGKRFISLSLAGHFPVATGLASQTISWIVMLVSGIF